MSPCCKNTISRLPTTYPIKTRKQETENVQSFTFDVSFGAEPGQFVMAWLPGVDEVPMSVALDDGSQTKITFFAVGDMTKELAKKKEGDLVGLRGPFGKGFEWKAKEHYALVAGGYGAAPMFFLANEAIKDGCTMDVIIGARSKDHLLYLEQIKALENVTLHIATDDGSMGHKGYNVDVLEQLLTAHSSQLTAIFACGPELMLRACFDLCETHNIPVQLSLERYMKCGYGLCGNCALDPTGIRLCVDGPVLKSETLRKITEFGKYHRDDLGKKHEL